MIGKKISFNDYVGNKSMDMAGFQGKVIAEYLKNGSTYYIVDSKEDGLCHVLASLVVFIVEDEAPFCNGDIDFKFGTYV